MTLPLYAWLGRGDGGAPGDYPGVIRFARDLDPGRVRDAAERLGLPMTESDAGIDVTLRTPEDAFALGLAIAHATSVP